jgi:site-specific DNA-cytosine methylase
MQPRSGDPKKGGTGHLTRTDGKTYCLDTGNTNAVEVIPMDFRYDEGFRPRSNGKSPTLTITNDSNCASGKALAKIGNNIRRLTPIECERLQTVKDNYTAHVSDSQRYKMLGNGWTVDVIAHIFSYLTF